MFFELNVNAVENISTSSIDVIESKLREIGTKTLVAFDCDAVLIDAVDPILSSTREEDLAIFSRQYAKQMNIEKFFDLQSIVLRDMQVFLVDEKWKDIIANLQSHEQWKSGNRPILVTACQTGKFRAIESYEDLRRIQLNQLGIHFETSWKNEESIKFTKFKDKAKSANGVPTFSNGMLLTGDISKGDALNAFLDEVKNRIAFDKVIFIDDKKINIDSVQKMAQARGMEFVGIEYTGVKKRPIDWETVKAQFERLIKNNSWK